jgi:nitric oxide reductase subunit B
VLSNGYWHARRLTFLMGGTFHTLEWIRIVADTVFLLLGAVPIAFATLRLVFSEEQETTA